MKHMPSGSPYLSDRLVTRWKHRNGIHSQGKRVAQDFYTKYDITKDEVEIYVEHGVIKATVAIRNRKQCTLREAFDTLNKARKYS